MRWYNAFITHEYTGVYLNIAKLCSDCCFVFRGGKCHGKTETLDPRKIPGSSSPITVKMPAVIRDKEDSESSTEDEQE